MTYLNGMQQFYSSNKLKEKKKSKKKFFLTPLSVAERAENLGMNKAQARVTRTK